MFKSNRIGVETLTTGSRSDWMLTFKSNRIGVETAYVKAAALGRLLFKSNRIGVETYTDSSNHKLCFYVQIEPYRG